MNSFDLTISIVSYNTQDLLQKCLGSIECYTKDIHYEIFVVDNASTDGSVQMIRSKFPQVKLIENPENRYFSKAHNQVLKIAQGRYCVILNPDTHFEENIFKALVDFMDRNVRIGAIGPKILNADGSLQNNGNGDRLPTLAYGFFEVLLWNTVFPGNFVKTLRARVDWDRNNSEEVESLGGACMMVRSSIFEKVGLMDEGFLMYWEETDWCQRIRQAGYALFFNADVKIFHSEGGSMKQEGKERKEKIFYESMFYYYKKHFGLAASVCLRVIFYVVMRPMLKVVRILKSIMGAL